MKVFTLSAWSLVASLQILPCAAQMTLAGRVVEGGIASKGIYRVEVEIRKGERTVGSGRTDENGDYSVKLNNDIPLSGARLVAMFSKQSYLENPAKVTFKLPISKVEKYELERVSLIPEGANSSYLVGVGDSLFETRKRVGDKVLIFRANSAVFALSEGSKAVVFDRVKALDPDLFESLKQADQANSTAIAWQKELLKSNPAVVVTPDFTFKDAILINGVPKNTADLTKMQKGITKFDAIGMGRNKLTLPE